MIRLSGIAYESLVNGPGIRRVYFAQGCIHNCEDCFNPTTHDFQGGKLLDMEELIKDVELNPMIKGITFSGGDPLEQADKFSYMAMRFKHRGLNIWCYTGYTFEYILEHQYEKIGWCELLKYVDVLVDGKFEREKKQINLKYRGSDNQRIIDVQKSINTGQIIILNYE